MESSEKPSVAVTSEVVSNNYAQQKIESHCKEVKDLKQKSIEQDQELKILRANQKNINERLRAQERYSRKDSVLIMNPPFNARTSKNVTYDTLKFFDDFLGVKLTVDSIKACHIIQNTETEYQMSTVICKFIYFNDKLEVLKKKRALRKAKNHINNKNIYMNEPLPEIEAQIKAEAVKRNMIVSTHNCTVSVLVDRGSQKPTYKKINDVEDLDNVLAVKKNTYNARSNNNDHDDHYSPAHKRQNTRQY